MYRRQIFFSKLRRAVFLALGVALAPLVPAEGIIVVVATKVHACSVRGVGKNARPHPSPWVLN